MTVLLSLKRYNLPTENLSNLVDNRLNVSQQHALIARRVNGILGCIKHQLLKRGNSHTILYISMALP